MKYKETLIQQYQALLSHLIILQDSTDPSILNIHDFNQFISFLEYSSNCSSDKPKEKDPQNYFRFKIMFISVLFI